MKKFQQLNTRMKKSKHGKYWVLIKILKEEFLSTIISFAFKHVLFNRNAFFAEIVFRNLEAVIVISIDLT